MVNTFLYESKGALYLLFHLANHAIWQAGRQAGGQAGGQAG